jgi:signal transduction histidine kinase
LLENVIGMNNYPKISTSSPPGTQTTSGRLSDLFQNKLFLVLIVLTLLTILFCYSPQLTVLYSYSTQLAWIVDLIRVPGYRFLILVSVCFAAWQFGIKTGLVIWVVLAVFIGVRLFINQPISGLQIDIADFGLALLVIGISGQQGVLHNKLKLTARELKRQSVQLKAEIEERKRSEERLIVKNAIFETQSEASLDGIFATNENQVVILCNKRFQEMWRVPKNLLETGQYDLLFRHILSQTRDSLSYEKQALKQIDDKLHKERFEIHMQDGRVFDTFSSPLIDKKGVFRGRIWYFRDVTDRKEMEQRLIMADRLASIGELVSGIAHELNNPLTGVIGYSQLLMEKEIDKTIKDDLVVISSEAERAARIIKNLLTFARKHSPVMQLSQINNIIEDVLTLRSYEHKVNNIEIIKNLKTDLPEIMADYFQIQQVFLNIVINAEYFMIQAHHRGRLIITTEEMNAVVRITFSDDGPGIPAENLRSIFDPFFTTKEVGKGTGLGLSICHGIVTEHGGRIYSLSEYGNGASFVIELPMEMVGVPSK